MSSKHTSPLKFSAGGNQSLKHMERKITPHMQFNSQAASPQNPSDGNVRSSQPSNNNIYDVNSCALSIITRGIALKRSPLSLKNWIACLLTLDGRDKFTKILQYSSRMLAWWFGVLSAKNSAKSLNNAHETHALFKNLSIRFNLLYKSFVESRKAFRIGRTFIEYDKLRSIGWGSYLMSLMRDPIGDGVDKQTAREEHLKYRYPTHSITEHRDENNSDQEAVESWNEDEDEKKIEQQPQKIMARPNRPHLPSRVSSNVGWGPTSSNDISAVSSNKDGRCPPSRTVSELGAMYKSSRYSDTTISKTVEAPPPPWKLIGSTLKLIGLMGFWAFDNLAFLTGTGFLDPFSTTKGSDPKSLRLQRKKSASEWGTRFYFMGCLAGLYVNFRAVMEHSCDALQKARDGLQNCLESQLSEVSEEDLTKAKQQLKSTEIKHFELYVALLKSICDCIVFSNNPGVDLHVKFRGKKNHEGLHCCCGLVSASTVLFGNFPNAKDYFSTHYLQPNCKTQCQVRWPIETSQCRARLIRQAWRQF